MLDIKFLRSNPEIVKQNIKNKFQDAKLPLVDEVIELDKRNREIKQEVEALRANKNQISKKSVHAWLRAKKKRQKNIRDRWHKMQEEQKSYQQRKKK